MHKSKSSVSNHLTITLTKEEMAWLIHYAYVSGLTNNPSPSCLASSVVRRFIHETASRFKGNEDVKSKEDFKNEVVLNQRF